MAQARLYKADNSPNQIQEDAEHSRTAAGPTNLETDLSNKIDDKWLLIARDAYQQAESYYDANIRHDHERNLSHFQNRHAPGSKYYSEGYKYRHKGFRPKTRSMVRRQEAALLKAMFSTADFVKVKAARSSHSTSTRSKRRSKAARHISIRSDLSLRIIGWVSGSPKRQLYSSTLGVPFFDIMTPA